MDTSITESRATPTVPALPMLDLREQHCKQTPSSLVSLACCNRAKRGCCQDDSLQAAATLTATAVQEVQKCILKSSWCVTHESRAKEHCSSLHVHLNTITRAQELCTFCAHRDVSAQVQVESHPCPRSWEVRIASNLFRADKLKHLRFCCL